MSFQYYGIIEFGDKILLDHEISRSGRYVMKTTIIKPDGAIYDECYFCERCFLRKDNFYYNNNSKINECDNCKKILEII